MSEETTTQTTPQQPTIEPGRYIEGVGRRKRAIARVRIMDKKSAKKAFVVNDREAEEYFPTEEMKNIAHEALNKIKAQGKYGVSVRVTGGGIHAQAEAVRLGLARALVTLNEELRARLKKGGLLKRDARVKERKKFGRKKARKSPQWSKR